MNERGLVEVPENAVRDDPIAFGLTGVQLGICGLAVLAAAVLNLLPLWEPVRLVVIVLGAGPIAVAAALPIRGEPAYRWLVRAVRHRRGPRLWGAELRRVDKPEISGRVETEAERSEEPAMPDQIVAPAAEEREVSPAMPAPSSAPPRLRVVRSEPDERPDESGEASPSPVPHLLGGLHVVCVTSFAGGVGKTTLAVETASLVGSRARYRTLDGDLRPLRVLLLDADRASPAAALRLGLDADTVSRLATRYDWPDALTFERRAVETPFGVTLLTLPPLPLGGLGPELPFGPIEAAAVLDAAEAAGFQLVVVDLGTTLEEGHHHLIAQAARVLGVVTPRVEALPDVIRIPAYVRALGAGRKLALIANRATDERSLPTLADEQQVPIVATIPALRVFDVAGDRAVPAWTGDAEIEALLAPLASAVWSLFPGVPATSERRLPGLLGGVRRRLRAGDAR
jgi:MinD-like ATPase involved in chromosome partitioning or flagellar assembly